MQRSVFVEIGIVICIRTMLVASVQSIMHKVKS